MAFPCSFTITRRMLLSASGHKLIILTPVVASTAGIVSLKNEAERIERMMRL